MTRLGFRVHRRIVLAATASVQVLVSVPAWAAGSNMPWEQPLNQILQSVEGPVAKILAVIIIIVTGLISRERYRNGFWTQAWPFRRS
jgi:type IV secretory pathway VirB2 component (pilin)